SKQRALRLREANAGQRHHALYRSSNRPDGGRAGLRLPRGIQEQRHRPRAGRKGSQDPGDDLVVERALAERGHAAGIERDLLGSADLPAHRHHQRVRGSDLPPRLPGAGRQDRAPSRHRRRRHDRHLLRLSHARHVERRLQGVSRDRCMRRVEPLRDRGGDGAHGPGRRGAGHDLRARVRAPGGLEASDIQRHARALRSEPLRVRLRAAELLEQREPACRAGSVRDGEVAPFNNATLVPVSPRRVRGELRRAKRMASAALTRLSRVMEPEETEMSEEKPGLRGPDLARGVPASAITDAGMLLGHAHGEPVLVARRGGELFAIGALCTHYGGPLEQGLLVDDTVRCPWHHACFSLRTGEALRPPALNPVSCWRLEQRDGKVYVREKAEAPGPPVPGAARMPQSVVILGGGAAGNAAAEMLRREGYAGRVTMLSADAASPYDRPNLSKGYLAGSAPEEWIPLRPAEFYKEQDIDLRLNARAAALDTARRLVGLADGGGIGYDALLLATGAEPVRLPVPGAELPHVHYLRTLSDSRALAARAAASKRAVVIGASFIGLEVAASLRARDVEVHVVGRETRPMEPILGAEVGDFIRKLHEQHGVTFH